MKNEMGSKNRGALLIIALVFICWIAEAKAGGVGPILTTDQIKADIELAIEVYERVHPGYTRYATNDEMHQAWIDLEQKAKDLGGMSLGDFYLGVQAVLAQIRCDHTKAELPKVLLEQRKNNPVYLPFRWSLIEGRGIVRVAPEGTGLLYGDEILSIDGVPLSELVEQVLPYIPFDGYTEWSRIGGVSESLEFRGGAIDHFGALLWSINPEAVIQIKTATGLIKEVSVNRIGYEEWLNLANKSARNFKDAVSFKRIGKKSAYLAVDTFVNYREYIDPNDIYDPIFDALEAEGRENLILDLRKNGGGSDDARDSLLNRLMLHKKKFYRDVQVKTLDLDGIKEHLWTWDKTAFSPNRLAFKKNKNGSYSFRELAGQHGKISPKKNVFKGKLIVLTSASNSSGSAMILAHLKDSNRATLIGEKAGGSAEGPTAGLLFTLTLPESGIKTRVPAIRHYTNIEKFEPGLSVEPDIYAPITVQAFREKIDPALQAAMSMLVE